MNANVMRRNPFLFLGCMRTSCPFSQMNIISVWWLLTVLKEKSLLPCWFKCKSAQTGERKGSSPGGVLWL